MSVSEETIRPLAAAPCLEDNAQVGVCDQTTCAVLGMNGLTAGEGFDFILTYPDSNLVGGWATPLKNMIVNWDDDIPNLWENKKWQPNHQPDTC